VASGSNVVPVLPHEADSVAFLGSGGVVGPIAATASVFTVLVLPGAAVSLANAVWRCGVTLHLSPLIIPAVILTSPDGI
jgi:hypothetical protein